MEQMINILLQKMLEVKASDLFVSTNNYPAMRIDGEIQFVANVTVQRDKAHQLYEEMTGMTVEESMQRRTEMDLAFNAANVGRFRVNVFKQGGELGFVFRHIPSKMATLEELYLPTKTIQKLCKLQRGLVLVTGVTGSGKSTTLASMVEHVNATYSRHILTIEDPIEFVYERKKSLLNQRELGQDTPDFATALKSAMRQSPDVILIGEMRDGETVSAALQAAETGHLVLSTLHTLNAIQTVERILAFFPPHQHGLIRLQMSLILEGVISQRLIRRADKKGRVPCVEILLATPTVKEMLEKGETRSLDKALSQEGHFGCQTFNQSLLDLRDRNLITEEDAINYSDNPDQLRMAFRGITKSKDSMSGTPLGGSMASSGPSPNTSSYTPPNAPAYTPPSAPSPAPAPLPAPSAPSPAASTPSPAAAAPTLLGSTGRRSVSDMAKPAATPLSLLGKPKTGKLETSKIELPSKLEIPGKSDTRPKPENRANTSAPEEVIFDGQG